MTISLTDYRPRSALVSQTTPIRKPRFPVFDAHNHLGEQFGGGWDKRPVSELLATLDEAGIRILVEWRVPAGRCVGASVLPECRTNYRVTIPDRHKGGSAMRKIRWGVLSTAKIGMNKVIPAMQRGKHCQITALASRDLDKAQAAAKQLRISKAYGSYEEILADPEIEAIYNPLPNHLHVPWSIKALQAGKHVLCEKPIGLSSTEAQALVDAAKQHPQIKVMEAFMFRFHPQWQRAKQLVGDGKIGELRTIQSLFSYNNPDPNNIRNIAAVGGGGLMDIGCYNLAISRFIFGRAPQRVCGIVEYDPNFKTDRLASGILDFGNGTATFTCGTQLAPYQRVNIFGTEGRIEIEIPFNAPSDRPCKMWHQRGTVVEEIIVPTCDQYTLQGDAFSLAIINDTPVPTPIEDAVANMKLIEAIIASAKSGHWVAA